MSGISKSQVSRLAMARQGARRGGAFVRYKVSEGAPLYEVLLADRDAIDREFVEAGLPVPEWTRGEDGVAAASLAVRKVKTLNLRDGHPTDTSFRPSIVNS